MEIFIISSLIIRKFSPCDVFLWEQPSPGVTPRLRALDTRASALRGSVLHIYLLEELAWKSTHMYTEVEPCPSHLQKRKCNRKGGGWWWVTAQAGCLQIKFYTGRWLLWHPKKRLLVFLVAAHFHPSSFQNNNAGKLDVILFRFDPFSSLEAWYIPPPPSPSPRLLHLLPAFMVMKVVTSLLNTQAMAGPLVKLQPRVLLPPITSSLFGLTKVRCAGGKPVHWSALSSEILKWFCGPHIVT